MKVDVSDQVACFIREQAPEPRRRLRSALRDLAAEHGDIRALEGPLSAYWRLRVGAYRILFAYVSPAGERCRIRCIFAERRGVVYDVFRRMLERSLLQNKVGE
jgi:mRNA-degrading endonuclease RelE of RelBE toxin-antitoxin system